MIDKSVEDMCLAYEKFDTNNYPKYALPSGYSFSFYKKGDEVKWAELEVELGQFESVEKGVEHFTKDFLKDPILKPEDRMLFVIDPSGNYVATGTLWNFEFLGKIEQNLHWIAVSDRCAGKGIAKALITRLLDLYNELGYSNYLFLYTGTWYYPAINIYKKFGFTEYCGERSSVKGMSDSDFKEYNQKAIKIVNEKLEQYKRR
ncbi:MAG: GNAT family N-acetyltransferase [Clostridia bacterium]|nr:GNAT family N-acetyltransferase [Clostridia bacterium]